MTAFLTLSHQALFGLCLMLLVAPTSNPPDRPPATIFGEYIGVGTSATGKLVTRKNDRVRIVRQPDGNTSVTVSLTFDRGQTCDLEGSAAWAKGQLVLTADGLDETKPCQLVLRFKGAMLTLQDTETRCGDVYCGTGGRLDGARFRKKP